MLDERGSKFLYKAREKHGGKYDYTLVVYTNNRTPVSIRCVACDLIFKQRPSNHLTHPGGGCKSCQKKNISISRSMDFSTFVVEASKVHKELYQYNESQFKNEDPLFVTIGCLRCQRSFKQRISAHLRREQGCPWCAKRSSYDHDEFVRRARLVHGEAYEYISTYVDSRTKVQARCLSCDEIWSVQPHNHVDKRSGCPKCYKKRYVSRSETEWLDTFGIPEENRSVWVKAASGKSYLVDALHDGSIYEFYGSYYHGDPRVVKHENVCLQANKTFGELFQRTIERHAELEQTHKVRYVWEFDWRHGHMVSQAHPVTPLP